MGVDLKDQHPDHYSSPTEDERALTLTKDWTVEEERRAKFKYEVFSWNTQYALTDDFKIGLYYYAPPYARLLLLACAYPLLFQQTKLIQL